MNFYDTIVAQTTPTGKSGVAILRISGNKAIIIAKKILKKLPKPRYVNYVTFKNTKNQSIDQGIALWFPSPFSFTGEDVLELHSHGSPIIINLLLKEILKFSEVRIAQPGEFSKRAFLNNKIDLNQAEAIIDLINANSEYESYAAINSVKGIFSKKIKFLMHAITKLRILIEANIDFSEEDISILSIKKIQKKLINIIDYINKIIKNAKFNSCDSGIKIVITGYPNVGKSSIFNALINKKKAIITDIAGTTRDVLEETIYINNIKFNIVDTAGIRNSNNKIERIGIKKAKQEINTADHILYVIDSTKISNKYIIKNCIKLIKNIKSKNNISIIRNKIDILNEKYKEIYLKNENITIISISTRNNIDILSLKKYLKDKFTPKFQNIENIFLVKERHIKILKSSKIYLRHSSLLLRSKIMNIELLAEDLRLAQLKISEISGKFTSNDLLEKIFSNFCIGK